MGGWECGGVPFQTFLAALKVCICNCATNDGFYRSLDGLWSPHPHEAGLVPLHSHTFLQEGTATPV